MANIQFYLLDLDYITNVFGRPIIRLFGKTIDNKSICCLDRNFEPYFYVMPSENSDLSRLMAKIKECKEEDSFVANIIIEAKKHFSRDITALKVFVNHPKDVPIISSIISGIGSIKEIMENDILFTKRYIIDKSIMPLMLCEASGSAAKEEGLNTEIVFNIDSINPTSESTNSLNALSFDIETYSTGEKYPDSKNDPIISIAFYGRNFSKVITWKGISHNINAIIVKNEQELISEFIKTIKEQKPDCIVGYFSDGFDFPYILDRSKLYGINLDIGLDNSQLKVSKRGMTSMHITGIPHIDVLKFIKNIMGGSLQLDSYSLNEVASALLNEKKLDFNINNIARIWDANTDEIESILNYNLKDAELTYKLFNVISFDICELTKLIGQPIDDVIRMRYGQLVEWYLIKKAKEFNELIPGKPRYSEKSERLTHTYQGASVYQPSPGLYENLVVFDFKSLYPSIIIAHNIDPGTLTNDEENSHKSPKTIDESGKPAEYCFSSRQEGFIPTVLKDIVTRRSRIKDIIKKEKKEDKILYARSHMLKIIANATYGMFGYSGARWYSRECAAAITAFGRDYILKAIEKAKQEGYNVIFSDTDSIAMVLGDKTKDDALKFMHSINESLPEFMELELENFYKRGLFVMKKNELEGAKKKYVLMDENDKLKIRGFETIRRDWSHVAKETQLKVFNIILKDRSIESAVEYVRQVIDDIRKKKVPIEKMVIKTQLRKEIKHYDNIGPHVRVAEKMRNDSKLVGIGTIISYVITEGKGMIRDRAKIPEECSHDEYDAEYYINNQIIPAIKTIFEAVGYTESILTENKEQSKLNSFFGG